MYFTLTESPIKECLTGGACIIFTNWDQKNCSDRNYIPDVVFNFLPRVRCEKHKKFDIRTLGFFKVEWSGTELGCLNSKKYQPYNGNNDTLKLAKKGSSRNINDLLEKYKSVLQMKKPSEGINRGFRLTDNQNKIFEQIKNSNTYFD